MKAGGEEKSASMNFRMMKAVSSNETVDARSAIHDALMNSPIPRPELVRNLGLYLLPMELKRFLFFDSLYKEVLDVPGIIVEFGCRWGQNLAIFQSLRSIYEPFNSFRTIVGFDTFGGLKGVGEKDTRSDFIVDGAYGVATGYDDYLDKLLALKETQSPVNTVKKFELVKGDASTTFAQYLDEHPETIVALAYFDLDIYQPTVECLKRLRPHLTKGSIVGFDELCRPEFRGETVAFQEVCGASAVRLRRNMWCHAEAFFVVE